MVSFPRYFTVCITYQPPLVSNLKSYIFRLYKTTIISFCVPEEYTTGNHTAVVTHSTVKPMEEISPLHEIFVKIAFGENFYNMQKYCKNIINKKAQKS